MMFLVYLPFYFFPHKAPGVALGQVTVNSSSGFFDKFELPENKPDPPLVLLDPEFPLFLEFILKVLTG
jgi:hypothetical protein